MINKITYANNLLLCNKVILVLSPCLHGLYVHLVEIAGLAQIRQVFIAHRFDIEPLTSLVRVWRHFVPDRHYQLPVHLSQD